MIEPVVEVSGLERHFPPATMALAGVDLTIMPAEQVAVTGPSGSGKSTLLSILGLLDQATQRVHRLCGQDVSGLDDHARTRMRREHIGFIFQSFHLIPYLTAEENVAMNLCVHGMARREALRAARAALDRVGLGHRHQARSQTMSGGEQQRVAIARALAHPPSLLLCDEPTGNLDTATTEQVLDLLLAPRPDVAVLIVTHDPAVAARCQRVVRVVDGKVVDS